MKTLAASANLAGLGLMSLAGLAVCGSVGLRLEGKIALFLLGITLFIIGGSGYAAAQR